MCRASIVRLFEWLVSTCLAVTAYKSTLCCLVHAWTAMPFFTSCMSLVKNGIAVYIIIHAWTKQHKVH